MRHRFLLPKYFAEPIAFALALMRNLFTQSEQCHVPPTIEKRVQIINLLVEGMSMRATSRLADVSINTVT